MNFQQAPVTSWVSKLGVKSKSLYSPAQNSQNVTAEAVFPFSLAEKNLILNFKNESNLTTLVHLNLEGLWHSWKQGSCSVYRRLPKSNLIKNKHQNQTKHQKNNLLLNMLGILSAYYQGLDDLFWFPRAQAGITTLNILCVLGRKEMRENWHK